MTHGFLGGMSENYEFDLDYKNWDHALKSARNKSDVSAKFTTFAFVVVQCGLQTLRWF